ncbi:MAG: MmcQ/YjbR family DNA-binding protein [Rikenellaceae bacterium]|nr:MmcQ/YjbR family DNA-binding protein [Rikenellaceae bacterium]MCL2691920.1 MmcQ/YjbR family DNA-binding protein [Rikenellaceae bacterium]
MNIEELREHCLAVRGAEESFPFNDTILAFKVMSKLFAYIDLEPRSGRLRVEMKCDPDRSIELRERYEGVSFGHFPSTLLWNAVYLESDVPDALIVELIAHSVDEVIKKLPRAKRQEYLDRDGGL